MGSHPINLALRFLLELSGLLIAGFWGWHQRTDWLRFVFAIILPLVIAAVWGTFNVAGDPSRSGSAPIPVPGLVRLAIELSFFGFATWALIDLGYPKAGWVFGIIVLLHNVFSYDRIRWLLAR